MAKHSTIDEYINALPDDVREVASATRNAIRTAAPNATETIKYEIPTFQIEGSSFLYFGVWKKHIGLYPIYQGTADFEKEIGAYRAKKDTVQFPLGKPVDHNLISKIVASQLRRLVNEKAERQEKGTL